MRDAIRDPIEMVQVPIEQLHGVGRGVSGVGVGDVDVECVDSHSVQFS